LQTKEKIILWLKKKFYSLDIVLNLIALLEKKKGGKNQEYKKNEKDKNKGIMEFPVLKTLPKTYYRIPNPGNGKLLKEEINF